MKRADDKLRDIFLEIRTDQPSAGFESKLMQQIQTVAAKENKKRSRLRTIYNTCALIGGIAAIVILPCVLFYFSGIEPNFSLSEINYSIKMPAINVNPVWILMSLSVLILLLADMFIRNYLKNKNHHNL
ncbi:MAG: hypothetical protein QM653_15125 [Dysgonomonas sp.]|uniref:hypothetical protein n=1 Tax=Dysgonomonas sp. TaxID=1891233 RepID=UPI0039E30423